jgi:adenosine deaminase
MRHSTLVQLARDHGIRLPPALTEDWPPHLSGTDERGWFRFQRLYDSARSVLRTEGDVRRLVIETAEDERAEGSRWLEIQVDPDGYAGRFGGITAMTELVLDAAARATAATGVGIGVIIAANRTKHPLEARTLARLAAQFTGHGVTGFGLSNDERRGPAHDFTRAFRIAERAGLLLVPHGGELAGPGSVAACLDELHADRIGHGIRAVEDPALVKRLAAEGVTCEVCPSSNVALGIAAGPSQVPLRPLFEAGVPVALGADDPLLFGPRLTAQYEMARHAHGFTDAELADLARASVLGSAAPGPLRTEMLTGIDEWLAEKPLKTFYPNGRWCPGRTAGSRSFHPPHRPPRCCRAPELGPAVWYRPVRRRSAAARWWSRLPRCRRPRPSRPGGSGRSHAARRRSRRSSGARHLVRSRRRRPRRSRLPR